MRQITVMRLLRLKYGVSLAELAKAVGVSSQYMSEIEFREGGHTESQARLAQKAFEYVIENRIAQAGWLSASFADNRHRLLDLVTEDFHEL